VSYCPKCRYEYQAGVLICPDCHVTLVDQLPPKTPAAVTPDDSWVPIGSVASQMKSEIAKGALNSSNIPSMILSSMFGAYGQGVNFHFGLDSSGGAKNVIMVPREYREEAGLILEAVLGDDLIQPEKR